MPLLSRKGLLAIAAVIGFLLMFWKRTVAVVGNFFKAIGRLFGRK